MTRSRLWINNFVMERNIIPLLSSYFNDKDGQAAEEDELEYIPAPGSPSAKQKGSGGDSYNQRDGDKDGDSDGSEDPLDKFMEGIEVSSFVPY